MSFRAKRELLVQVAPRYRAARHGQRSFILDEFIAVTGHGPQVRQPRAALFPTLERHGHLILTDEVREQVLALSSTTADRLLRPRYARSPNGATSSLDFFWRLTWSPIAVAVSKDSPRSRLPLE